MSAFEKGVIEHFASWGEVVGVPPSVAQIYGLLYASAAPVSFEEIRERLVMSQGSVSQGLRFLRTRELLVVTQTEGRKEHYAAIPALGRFIQVQLKGEVAPRLDAAAKRIPELAALAGGDALKLERIERLRGWNSRGRELLPVLLAMMGG